MIFARACKRHRNFALALATVAIGLAAALHPGLRTAVALNVADLLAARSPGERADGAAPTKRPLPPPTKHITIVDERPQLDPIMRETHMFPPATMPSLADEPDLVLAELHATPMPRIITPVDYFPMPPIAVPTSPAIPEPSTWAMLILGFGAAGARLRWRRFKLWMQDRIAL